MPSIKKNILVNLVGRFWGAALGVILIPQYIKYLGIESYGLVGFYGTLIGSMAVLDLGLSTTLNRELARHKSEARPAADTRNLVFSMECIYCAIGLVISILVIALSGFIATHWVKAEQLPVASVKKAVMLMGVVVAFQWPISLYYGGLTGLEKQVLNNGITIIMSTLRAAGVILVLAYYSPTIQSFFLWQAAVSLLYVVAMRWGLWSELPACNKKPVFSKHQIRSIWRFAAGITGLSLVTFFLSQLDKIILSKILPLSQFAYYNVAFSATIGITLLVNPVTINFFPRFTSLVTLHKNVELAALYHRASRLVATIVFPVGLMLVLFPREILWVWTKNPDTTLHSYTVLKILTTGTICNSLMIVPYYLLLANGNTRFLIFQNSIAAIVLVPLLFILTNLYGSIGAAFVWLAVNAGCLMVSIPLMHQKLLKGEMASWYWSDTFLPMLPSLLILLSIKLFFPYFFPGMQLRLAELGFIFFATTGISLFFYRDFRRFMMLKLHLAKAG